MGMGVGKFHPSSLLKDNIYIFYIISVKSPEDRVKKRLFSAMNTEHIASVYILYPHNITFYRQNEENLVSFVPPLEQNSRPIRLIVCSVNGA